MDGLLASRLFQPGQNELKFSYIEIMGPTINDCLLAPEVLHSNYCTLITILHSNHKYCTLITNFFTPYCTLITKFFTPNRHTNHRAGSAAGGQGSWRPRCARAVEATAGMKRMKRPLLPCRLLTTGCCCRRGRHRRSTAMLSICSYICSYTSTNATMQIGEALDGRVMTRNISEVVCHTPEDLAELVEVRSVLDRCAQHLRFGSLRIS
jgi:hypothetical protein